MNIGHNYTANLLTCTPSQQTFKCVFSLGDAGRIYHSELNWQYNLFYYPNLIIMPVDNNEHQRIDDVSTDRML